MSSVPMHGRVWTRRCLPAVLMFLSVLLNQQMLLCEGFRIAAFNIKKLGHSWRTMTNRQFSVPILTFICTQDWDIVFLQELTSIAELNGLTRGLNAVCGSSDAGGYDVIPSSLQPTNARRQHQELYAYLFRDAKVRSADILHGQYPHPQAMDFYRPPFIVRFEVPELEICMPSFGLIGIHIKPDRAVREISNLANVYYQIQPGLQNALILGDLNADCTFFTRRDKLNSPLRNAQFHWLVEDGRRTNPLAIKGCTYDRILAAGEQMRNIANNVQIPEWGKLIGMPRDLSDHWPVSIDLSCHVNSAVGGRGRTGAYHFYGGRGGRMMRKHHEEEERESKMNGA